MDENKDPKSDDDFDETLLWEIASLLKTKNIPNKDSFLPLVSDAIEHYFKEEKMVVEDDNEAEDLYHSEEAVQHIMTKLPNQPLTTPLTEDSKEPFMHQELALACALKATKIDLPQSYRDFWLPKPLAADDYVGSMSLPSQELSFPSSPNLWSVSESGATKSSSDLVLNINTSSPTIPRTTKLEVGNHAVGPF